MASLPLGNIVDNGVLLDARLDLFWGDWSDQITNGANHRGYF